MPRGIKKAIRDDLKKVESKRAENGGALGLTDSKAAKAEPVCQGCTDECRNQKKKAGHYGPNGKTWCNFCKCQEFQS